MGCEHNRNLLRPCGVSRFGDSMLWAPFYCKVDVEGWELEVLRGLTQPLPLVSFEFSPHDQNIRKTVACLEQLCEFGPGESTLPPRKHPYFISKNGFRWTVSQMVPSGFEAVSARRSVRRHLRKERCCLKSILPPPVKGKIFPGPRFSSCLGSSFETNPVRVAHTLS